ncbi:beta 1-4 rhamnosyltransferase Cps2T [Alkalicoccobacillus gibsonii]|uniref:beta 1-4 rhamnosyltransferase Cps2T n=1 Tax=Alkalicoccobacillus gibsonii TaxID=79881 RepID=UPI003513F3CB
MKDVFIIGSKGIPARYGGFETFVDYLTRLKKSPDLAYHVACMADNNDEFYHNNVRCFNIKTPNIGSSKAILYDIYALKEAISYIENKNIKNATIYILACRIGPFIKKYKRKMIKLGIKLYVNPDGNEWRRSKWSFLVRKYWKISEGLMVKYADLLVCDSMGIVEYINEEYKVHKPKTEFIAYGADVKESPIGNEDKRILDWEETHSILAHEYYLIVGRFVPENNYKLMISEFMLSNSDKDLVIISNVEENDFYKNLLHETKFMQDKRIKFVGTVYDQELLTKIRERAYGYIHGHEVGGTNPSLLEALASTQLNLLLDVNFNKEVGENGAKYFNKVKTNLSNLINASDSYDEESINLLSLNAKTRIKNHYSWDKIVSDYESLFIRE